MTELINQGESSRIAAEIVEAVQRISHEWMRPSVTFKPQVFRDGDQFCCILGSNPQEGIAGFGYTPDQATRAFDEEWYKIATPAPQGGKGRRNNANTHNCFER